MFTIPENIFWILAGPSFIAFLISTLCFTRISMKHIEKKMRDEGIHEPLWDKGIGIRVTMYGKVIRRQKQLSLTTKRYFVTHALLTLYSLERCITHSLL